MKNLSKVLIVSCLALCAFAVAGNGDVDLRAQLTGTGNGKAEWKTQDRGTRLRAELEVDGEHLAANSPFAVTVGTNAPFMVTTDAFGEFESDMRFNGANRPTVNVGDSVTVADGTNTVVLSGVLAAH
jgi:hypothetical protein